MTVRAGRWVSDMPYPPGRSVEQTGARSSLRGTGGRRVVRAPADAGRSKFEEPAARAGSYFLPRGDSAQGGRPFARCSRPEPLGFVYPYRLDQASYDRMLRLVEKRRTTDVWRTIYDMHGLDMKELEEVGGDRDASVAGVKGPIRSRSGTQQVSNGPTKSDSRPFEARPTVHGPLLLFLFAYRDARAADSREAESR
jgi:hypothetical protein